ncbi:MAG TPA: Rieske 2Fe-2S domain-containing protein [Nitrososphaeraceae archaeon]|nr:Rieske 2Fe-2S domain-containing protein [Nitrososphaeraceae archaeon]
MSKDFVNVTNTKDIPPSHMKEVEVNGESICVANVEGKYYAIGSICTHEGGPLADGTLEGYEVECPWHNSKFDIRTGEVTSPPASEPEPAYEVKVDGNSILIKTHGEGKKSPPQIELTLLEKDKIEGTDETSFKFSKQNDQGGGAGSEGAEDITPPLNYTAGQFAFFDIGGVYNDPKGPIRHFTISSSPTENFIMFSTRIRDSPYKKRASTLEEGARVKVRGPEQQQSSSTANDWKGGYGRIDKTMILKYLDTNMLNNSVSYICGPPSMLKAMQSLLQDNLEIPKERIKVEEFTGY